MVDFYDRASEQETNYREDALAAHRRKMALQDGSIEAARACIECDDDIPDERRSAVPGTQLCVECQRRHERLG